MKPLAEVADNETDELAIVVFVANADQLSALATLANFGPLTTTYRRCLALDVEVS